MHAGTHFLMWELFKDWTDWSKKEPESDRGYTVRHFDDVFEATIAPMRHPQAIAQSWINRGEDLDRMVRQFDNLVLSGTPCLPIDNPTREDRLRELSASIGEELSTEWPVMHYDSGSRFYRAMNQEQFDLVQNLMERHRAFLKGLGYS